MIKRWYLLGMLMKTVTPLGLALCGVLLLIQQMVLRVVTRAAFTGQTLSVAEVQQMTLDKLMQRAGFAPLFLILLVLGMSLLAWSVARLWIGSRSIYALCSLPLPRGWLYGCWLLCGLFLTLLLAATQYASVWLSNEVLEKAIGGWMVRTQTTFLQTDANAVFMAFIRWEFLRPFLPYTLLEVLTSAAFLIGPSALTLLVVLGIFAGKRGSVFGIGGLWLAAALLTTSSLSSPGFFTWLGLLAMLLLTVWAVFDGSRQVRNGAIL